MSRMQELVRADQAFCATISRWDENLSMVYLVICISGRAWSQMRAQFPQVAPAAAAGQPLPKVINVPGEVVRFLMGGFTCNTLMSALRTIATIRHERSIFSLS